MIPKNRLISGTHALLCRSGQARSLALLAEAHTSRRPVDGPASVMAVERRCISVTATTAPRPANCNRQKCARSMSSKHYPRDTTLPTAPLFLRTAILWRALAGFLLNLVEKSLICVALPIFLKPSADPFALIFKCLHYTLDDRLS